MTKSTINSRTSLAGKGVSDLETCMDYFALKERSCENIIVLFSFPYVLNTA